MRVSGELGEAKSRSWGTVHLHPTHFPLVPTFIPPIFLLCPPSSHPFPPVGAQDARHLTFGVPGSQGHEGAGRSEAGTMEKQGKGSGCLPPPAAPSHPPAPRSPFQLPHSPTALPAHQPRGPGAKAVHEDPQRQGGGAEHEGANGEAQVEHLFLLVAAGPPMRLVLGGVGGVLS